MLSDNNVFDLSMSSRRKTKKKKERKKERKLDDNNMIFTRIIKCWSFMFTFNRKNPDLLQIVSAFLFNSQSEITSERPTFVNTRKSLRSYFDCVQILLTFIYH